MSSDLAIGIAVITGLSVFSYGAGRRISNRADILRPWLFAAALLFTIAFAWTLSGRLAWAVILPMASVVLWSNLMPALLSFCAGMASTSNALNRWHRPATIGLLAALTAGYTLMPVVRPLVAPAETAQVSEWSGNICLQSHSSTCAPAAAVTLLRSAGIEAEEHDLTRACMTSDYGTEALGLFRGLVIASKPYLHRPRVASSDPKKWQDANQLPNVALVRFQTVRPTNHPGAMNRFLGPQGEGHAVVILGRGETGRWLIADPAFGTTSWSYEELMSRFTGDAIYLTRD